MKFISSIICLSAILVITAADPGQYVPRAFYRIDDNGFASPINFIQPEHQESLLKRLRRSPQVITSSSSSSSSSNGGPTYFAQHSSVSHTPAFGIDSRFGGDDERPTGVYHSTAGVIDEYGNVYSNTRRGNL